MDTDALRWFQQVADGVTVTEVSEVEGISQPGVSRALSRLERELGTPLLRRSGRTLRMTRAGSAFKRHVDALLHQLDDGFAAVNQILDPETGTLALAFQMSLGTWLVPDLVRSFRQEHPHVRFDLSQVRDELVDSVLANGDADLVLSSVPPSDPTVERRRLIDQPLRLAVPADHPLVAQRELRLADAASEPFLMLHRTSLLRRVCDELCRAAGFEPRRQLRGRGRPHHPEFRGRRPRRVDHSGPGQRVHRRRPGPRPLSHHLRRPCRSRNRIGLVCTTPAAARH